MNLSKRGEYALRALIDLGIASELGWPMLQVSELAREGKTANQISRADFCAAQGGRIREKPARKFRRLLAGAAYETDKIRRCHPVD